MPREKTVTRFSILSYSALILIICVLFLIWPTNPASGGNPERIIKTPATFLHDISFDGAHLWAVAHNAVVFKIDPRTGTTLGKFKFVQDPEGGNPQGTTGQNNLLWVSRGNSYFRIDGGRALQQGSSQGCVIQKVDAPRKLIGRLSWCRGGFWTHNSRRIYLVDHSGGITRSIPIPGTMLENVDGGIAFDGVSLFIPVNRLAPKVRIYRIDPCSGEITASYVQRHFNPSISNLVGLAADERNGILYNYVFPYGPIYITPID
jgi:hypothetical protein